MSVLQTTVLSFVALFFLEGNKGLLEHSLSVTVLQITLITSEVVHLYKLLIVLPLSSNTALGGVLLIDPAKDMNISAKCQSRRSN